MRLHDALDQAPVAALRRMAEIHGLGVDDATTRAELVEHLQARLSDPAYLGEQLASLEPHEQRGLRGASAGGGEIRGFLLNRLLQRDDPEAARSLIDRGFLFRTFAPTGPHRGEVFAVPDEVLAALPPGDDGPARAAAPPSPGQPPPRAARRASDPVFSLFVLASALQRDAAPSDIGTRASRFEQEVAAWAHEPAGWPWPERWAFLRHLAIAAGLLERREDGGEVVPGRLGRLLSDRHDVAERLWRAYLHDRTWHEVVRAAVPHGELLAEQIDAAVVRGVVLGLLGRFPEGHWLTVSELLGWIERAAPTVLREQLDSRSAALFDPSTGGPLFAEGSWQRIEAVVLRYILLGPLYWLGVVACDSAGERLAVTSAGAALIRGAPAEDAQRGAEPCTWQPDGLLVVSSRADLGTLLRVERYLLLEYRGQVSRYRLRRAEVAATLAEGGSVVECQTLLQRLTRADLPAEVQRWLDDWGERFGAVVLRPAVLLETRSSDELDAIDPAVIRRRLTPTVAEIPASAALDLAESLRAAGHLPRVDAALRLMAGRKAYAGLVDEQVLEFLLVSLMAFEQARPEQLAQLEGAFNLKERLAGLFPRDRVDGLRDLAQRLAGDLLAAPQPGRPRRRGSGARR